MWKILFLDDSMTLDEIKQLIKKNNTEIIYQALNSLPIKSKGLVFECFLVELFKGNGWHVIHNGKRNDLGADLLIYKSFVQNSPSFIIQAKNISRPLTFDQTKIELMKFEDLASKKYNCSNYLLYSLNGYTDSSKALEKFNMSINDQSDISTLIANYSEKNYGKKSSILLAPHNKVTYLKVKQLSQTVRKLAVVQATGTGKSYLISSQLNDQNDKNLSLFVAPTNIIIEKQKANNPWLKNVEYKTYQQLVEDDQSGRLGNKYNLIILDELHRSGASKWQVAIENLLKHNKSVVFTGYSATPIRYLDSARDMSKELFDNNVIYGPDLAEAIARNILMRPHYITAIYETEDRLSEKFKQNSDLLKSAILNWCGHEAIEKIISKHPLNNGDKYIVFCESLENIQALKAQLEYAIKISSFKRKEKLVLKSIEVGYRNSHKENNRRISEFERDENNIKLLFCVNILNEGLHVKNINGVFLFRKTISINIYLQQIGRAVSFGSTINPIIFDFAQNCENISEVSLGEEISKAREKINSERKSLGLNELILINNIISEDYTKDFFEIIRKLKDNSEPWNIKYNQLKDYFDRIGNTNIPQRSSPLGKFVSRNREDFRNNCLSEDRIKKLRQINFNFELLKDMWHQNFDYCLSFADKNGMLPVIAKDPRSKTFYESVRRQNRQGSVSILRKFILDTHGFVWNVTEYYWAEKLLNIARLEHSGVQLSQYCIKTSSIGKWIYRHKTKANKLNFNF